MSAISSVLPNSMCLGERRALDGRRKEQLADGHMTSSTDHPTPSNLARRLAARANLNKVSIPTTVLLAPRGCEEDPSETHFYLSILIMCVFANACAIRAPPDYSSLTAPVPSPQHGAAPMGAPKDRLVPASPTLPGDVHVIHHL